MPAVDSPPMPPSLRELSNKAAIVGIGESDFHLDYQAWRAGSSEAAAPNETHMIKVAFERALADSGLERKNIDGLSVSLAYDQFDPVEMARALALKPSYLISNGNIMAGPLPVACAAIAARKCDTIAMVYAVAPRARERRFGGSTYTGYGSAPSSYSYYHPWGWTSQAAHWAMMCSYYHATYRTNDEDLGSVAIQLRQNAMRNPNAVMQTPLSIEGYLAARHIVRPLRLFDLCMVNDGAVCLIVSRSDRAHDLPHAPVLVAGWGESRVKADKMRALIQNRLQVQMQDATQHALAMAGLQLADVGHFEGYDVASIHLVSQIEGHGFVPVGTAMEFCKSGEMAFDGKLPVNTGGGNLSGSYMHGWSQVLEVTRQLRHDAGARQIGGLQASMSSLVQTDRAHPILYVRGA